MGLRWPAAGLGALTAAGPARDLLKEVAIIFITSTIVWPQVKQQGRNTALPINRKLDGRFTEHGPAHQNKTQFPSQSVYPIISLLSFSIRGRQTENHNLRKLTNLITWTTALSNSMKL